MAVWRSASTKEALNRLKTYFHGSRAKATTREEWLFHHNILLRRRPAKLLSRIVVRVWSHTDSDESNKTEVPLNINSRKPFVQRFSRQKREKVRKWRQKTINIISFRNPCPKQVCKANKNQSTKTSTTSNQSLSSGKVNKSSRSHLCILKDQT